MFVRMFRSTTLVAETTKYNDMCVMTSKKVVYSAALFMLIAQHDGGIAELLM